MAGPTRFELATSGVTGRRSNQLNYDPARSLVGVPDGFLGTPVREAKRSIAVTPRLVNLRQPSSVGQPKSAKSAPFNNLSLIGTKPTKPQVSLEVVAIRVIFCNVYINVGVI